MTTANQASPATSTHAAQAAAVPTAAAPKPVAVKRKAKPLAPKSAAKKPAPKSVAPVKAAAKKPLPSTTSAKKAALKKAPVKTPLSKAFANAKLEKVAKVANDKSPEKAKKPKLVRDSFTIPKAEYLVLDELKQRATKLTRPAKKSELLRAGIKALAALSDAAFLTALQQVPAIKTGRPTLTK